MQNIKRIMTFTLLLVLCFVTLFFVAALAVGSGHECVGENCFVCAGLSLNRELNEAQLAVSIAIIISTLLFAIALRVVREMMLSRRIYTLYSLGVSLLD